jgi:hypothetical protein
MTLTESETKILISAMQSVIFEAESDRRLSVRIERKLERWLVSPDCIFENAEVAQ